MDGYSGTVYAHIAPRHPGYVVALSVTQSLFIAPLVTLAPHQRLAAEGPFDDADFALFLDETSRIEAAHAEIYDRVIRECRAPTDDEMHRTRELIRELDAAQAKLELTRASLN